MRLHSVLQLDPCATIAIIGAGGKTTALWRLAEERRTAGALVTTSTHILQPSADACDTFCSPESWDALRTACTPGRVTCAAYPDENGQCTGLPPDLFSAALANGLPILYEADDTARQPAGLHPAGSPVLYPGTDTVLILAGLRALGRPVCEVCHRYTLSAHMAADPQRPFDTGDLLETIQDSIRACGMPPARIRILVNQADTPRRFSAAAPVLRQLRDAGYFVRPGGLRNPFWP